MREPESLGRRTRIRSRAPRLHAQVPLLPWDSRIDRDSPVEADSVPCSGGPDALIDGQLEYVGVFSGPGESGPAVLRSPVAELVFRRRSWESPQGWTWHEDSDTGRRNRDSSAYVV